MNERQVGIPQWRILVAEAAMEIVDVGRRAAAGLAGGWSGEAQDCGDLATWVSKK